MPGSFPRATSPSDLDAGQCILPKAESEIRWATSDEQRLAPAWLGCNPGTHNNNAGREPNGFLPVRVAAVGSTESLIQPISDAHHCARTRRSIFGRALRLTGSRRQRKLGRAPPLGQAVLPLETDLPFVVCSTRCHTVSLSRAGTRRTRSDPRSVHLETQFSRRVKRRLPACLRFSARSHLGA